MTMTTPKAIDVDLWEAHPASAPGLFPRPDAWGGRITLAAHRRVSCGIVLELIRDGFRPSTASPGLFLVRLRGRIEHAADDDERQVLQRLDRLVSEHHLDAVGDIMAKVLAVYRHAQQLKAVLEILGDVA